MEPSTSDSKHSKMLGILSSTPSKVQSHTSGTSKWFWFKSEFRDFVMRIPASETFWNYWFHKINCLCRLVIDRIIIRRFIVSKQSFEKISDGEILMTKSIIWSIAEPISLTRAQSMSLNRPLSSEAVLLRVKGISGSKNKWYRTMRITNEFFGVYLPGFESQ